jgi:hypothetical protein
LGSHLRDNIHLNRSARLKLETHFCLQVNLRYLYRNKW